MKMSSIHSETQDLPAPMASGGTIEIGADSSQATVTGATRASAEEVQSHIDLVEDSIKKETNPVRLRNAEVCLEFVKKHGYPAPGYRFLIHQGVMKVLKLEDFRHRTKELAEQTPGCLRDTYGLVRG